MKKFLLPVLVLFSSLAFSSGQIHNYDDPLKVTFIKNPHKTHDLAYQQQLRNTSAWQQFRCKLSFLLYNKVQ